MKIEMDKKYTQIKFKSSYEHGYSISNIKGIAKLNLCTKVQTAARILLEARKAKKRINVAEFVNKFIKATILEVGVAEVIHASKLARAARHILKEKYGRDTYRERF